jgi:hypothetical protein
MKGIRILRRVSGGNSRGATYDNRVRAAQEAVR